MPDFMPEVNHYGEPMTGHDATAGLFCKEYDEIARRQDLSSTGKMLLSLLGGYPPGQCFPSQKTLGNALGLSARQVIRETSRLAGHGLLKIDRAHHRGSNHYTLTNPISDPDATFTKHPEWLRQRLDLTSCEKRLLAYTFRRAGKGGYCTLRPTELAKVLGISLQHIRRVLHRLVKYGWLEPTNGQSYQVLLEPEDLVPSGNPEIVPKPFENRSQEQDVTCPPLSRNKMSPVQEQDVTCPPPLEEQDVTLSEVLPIRPLFIRGKDLSECAFAKNAKPRAHENFPSREMNQDQTTTPQRRGLGRQDLDPHDVVPAQARRGNANDSRMAYSPPSATPAVQPRQRTRPELDEQLVFVRWHTNGGRAIYEAMVAAGFAEVEIFDSTKRDGYWRADIKSVAL